jgi:hypothetical protein
MMDLLNKTRKMFFRHFLSNFNYLSSTGTQTLYINVKDDFTRLQLVQLFEKSLNYVKETQLISDGQTFIYPVLDLESTLYKFKKSEQRIIFLKSIITELAAKTSEYFDYQYDDDNKRIGTEPGFETWSRSGAKVSQIVNKYSNGESLDSKYEEYVVHCYLLRRLFIWQLDALCMQFSLDLQELQFETGVKIQKSHDWSVLSYYGYSQQEYLKKVNLRDLNSGENLIANSPIENAIVQTGELVKVAPSKSDFDKLFNSHEAKEYVIQMMIDLRLMDELRVSLIGQKEKSKLLAFANALDAKKIIYHRGHREYSKIFLEFLGLKVTELKTGTRVYDDFHDEVISYINKNNL